MGYIDPQGYVIIYINGKRLRENRVKMSRHIGRPLLRSEHVHHINGIRHDNRIKNLKIMAAGEHTRHHCKGRVMSKEQKLKISKTRKTLHWSPSKKQRITQSKFMKQNWKIPSYKAQQHLNRLKSWDAKRRAKCSERMKKFWRNPQNIEEFTKKMKMWASVHPEHYKKMSDISNGHRHSKKLTLLKH